MLICARLFHMIETITDRRPVVINFLVFKNSLSAIWGKITPVIQSTAQLFHFFPMTQLPLVGQGLLIISAHLSHLFWPAPLCRTPLDEL